MPNCARLTTGKLHRHGSSRKSFYFTEGYGFDELFRNLAATSGGGLGLISANCHLNNAAAPPEATPIRQASVGAARIIDQRSAAGAEERAELVAHEGEAIVWPNIPTTAPCLPRGKDADRPPRAAPPDLLPKG